MGIPIYFIGVVEYLKNSNHEYLNKHPGYREVYDISISFIDGAVDIWTKEGFITFPSHLTMQERLDNLLLNEDRNI